MDTSLQTPTVGQLINASSRANALAIVGCTSDEGESREGARFAPEEIRRHLYRAPVDPSRPPRAAFDLGDELTPAGVLGYRSLRLGGGGAALIADAAAIAREVQDPQVVQVSARPRPLAGIASHPRLGVRDGAPADDVVTLDEWLDSGLTLLEVAERLPLDHRRPTFLAIHLDAFTLPGVAEPSALGLTANAFWPLYRVWLRRLDVRACGIYGVLPPLDPGGVTAAFAARLAFAFLHV